MNLNSNLTLIIIMKNTKRDLVYLETFKTEEQLFEELNLIQTETPNVYHRVEKVDIQELKDYLKNENQFAKEHELYKEYFEYGKVENPQKTFTPIQIETDLTYLKTDFVSNFYIEQLKNQNNDFYKSFEINENGIQLKSAKDLQKVKDYIKVNQDNKLIKELEDYSVISRHLPLLKTDLTQTDVDNKTHLLNNPQLIKEATSEIINVDSNSVFVKNSAEEIIKIGNNIYELKGTEGNKSYYIKTDFKSNTNYFTKYKNTDDYTNSINISTPQIEQYNKINNNKGIDNKLFEC